MPTLRWHSSPRSTGARLQCPWPGLELMFRATTSQWSSRFWARRSVHICSSGRCRLFARTGRSTGLQPTPGSAWRYRTAWVSSSCSPPRRRFTRIMRKSRHPPTRPKPWSRSRVTSPPLCLQLALLEPGCSRCQCSPARRRTAQQVRSVGAAAFPFNLMLAREFYSVIAIAILGGTAITFFHLDPIKALYWSAVINGLAAVPVMVVVMLMASSQRVMGRFAISGLLKAGGWLATVLMAAAAVGMFIPG
ncbi:membrane protein of unknown function (plasmid) [Pararobbsia alpina]